MVFDRLKQQLAGASLVLASTVPKEQQPPIVEREPQYRSLELDWLNVESALRTARTGKDISPELDTVLRSIGQKMRTSLAQHQDRIDSHDNLRDLPSLIAGPEPDPEALKQIKLSAQDIELLNQIKDEFAQNLEHHAIHNKSNRHIIATLVEHFDEAAQSFASSENA